MLKARIVSSAVLILLLSVVWFFADRFWFYVALVTLILWGIGEICQVNIKKRQTEAAYIILPIVYIIFSLFWAAGELRWKDNGWWLILAIAGTTAYDTLAYFMGKSLGRRKITPKISPNKTWEGTIGGFFGSLPTTALIGSYLLQLHWLQIVSLGFLIGILAFYGDLLVSWYKRKLGIKDMGSLIPGHGGLLDRIDSHLLVILGVFLTQGAIIG